MPEKICWEHIYKVAKLRFEHSASACKHLQIIFILSDCQRSCHAIHVDLIWNTNGKTLNWSVILYFHFKLFLGTTVLNFSQKLLTKCVLCTFFCCQRSVAFFGWKSDNNKVLQAYLILVIFFIRAKFLANKIYTEKTRKLR